MTFEIDRGTPSPTTVAPSWPVSVQAYRRCHIDGLALDMFGDCARCTQARYDARRKSRTTTLIVIAACLAGFLALVVLYKWNARSEERVAQRTALEISARSPGRLTVYTMAGCSACEMARSHMDSKGIPYVERRIDDDATAYAELQKLHGGSGVVPTFVVGDEVLKGFDARGILLQQAMAKHGLKPRAASPEEQP